MDLNRSTDLFKGHTTVLSNMLGLNIVDASRPLLVAFTGLLTFTAMLVGYLYLQRRALRDASRQRLDQHRTAGIEQQEDDDAEEEMLEGEARIDRDSWPVDNEDLFKNPSKLTNKEIDALRFCGHIPSEIKKAKVKATQKKIEQEMTDEQKENERDLQREQLRAIFTMMEEQKDKFGVGSVDDINEQMNLYM